MVLVKVTVKAECTFRPPFTREYIYIYIYRCFNVIPERERERERERESSSEIALMVELKHY